jgi:hypothetical protein
VPFSNRDAGIFSTLGPAGLHRPTVYGLVQDAPATGKKRRCRVALPYREKTQDLKKQAAREETANSFAFSKH